MNVDNNIFEGLPVKGKARHVFSRGRAIVDDGRFVGEAGAGAFVKSQPFFPVAL
jgi:dihydropyrimidinase